MKEFESKKIVAIIGAGFGGLSAARQLGEYLSADYRLSRRLEVMLIDRHSYQTFTPMLYEIATTSKLTANSLQLEAVTTLPIERALANLPVKFIRAEVTKIDIANRSIALKEGKPIRFDYLVVACGTETNFYGIKGLQENSYPLKTFIDAVRIRDAVEALFADPAKTHVDILVGGGGSNGVEFAAECAVWAQQLEKTYRKRGAAHIMLIEAGPEILTALDPITMEKARTRLEDLGVIIRTDAPITEVSNNEVHLATGEKLRFDALIWTGGTKTGSLIAEMAVMREKRGRAEVHPTLECIEPDPKLKFDGQVYAVGDITCLKDPKTDAQVPGIARAAIEQGRVAAYNIVADISKTPKKEFSIHPYPYVLTAGGKWAVAKINRFVFAGIVGWILKGLMDLWYLVSVLPVPFALKTWLKGLSIFVRND